MASAPTSLPNDPNAPNWIGALINKLKKRFAGDADAGDQGLVFSTDSESRGITRSDLDSDGENNQALADQTYQRMKVEAGRLAAYRDYDLMDSEQPEVCAALDVISEFATQGDDPRSETFNIQTDSEKYKTYIQDKVKQLNLHSHVTPTARDIAKYGGSFWELVATADGQIVDVKPLPPETVDRNETKNGTLKKLAFTQVDRETTKTIAQFANWQIVHGRYMKKHGRKYGNSILESARRVYKQLQVVQDGLVIQRTYRSHSRFLFQIPVDGMSVVQADNYVKQKKNEFRKKSRLNSQYNKPESYEAPISASEDFFVGVKKEGVSADVKMLQGEGGMNELGDVEYLQSQLIMALGVPKGLLGLTKEAGARSGNILTEQDVNFARRLYRMQQIVKDMVTETLRRCMIMDGIDPDAEKWTIVLPSISTIDDLRNWQIQALKSTVAMVYGQKLPIVDKTYIYTQIMELPAEEITRLEALDPSELGVAPIPGLMPSGEDFGQPGSSDSTSSLPDNNPMGAEKAKVEWAKRSDEEVVMAMRKKLGISNSQEISDGEFVGSEPAPRSANDIRRRGDQ